MSAAPSIQPVPPFTAEHDALRNEIRSFVAEELRPHAAEWERARWFPDDVFRLMGERGLLGIKYPREYGGRGLGYVEDALLAQELARCGSGGLAAGITVGARDLIGGYVEGTRKYTVPEIQRNLALHLENHFDANQRQIDGLLNWFRVSCVLLALQVVAWILDLTTGDKSCLMTTPHRRGS